MFPIIKTTGPHSYPRHFKELSILQQTGASSPFLLEEALDNRPSCFRARCANLWRTPILRKKGWSSLRPGSDPKRMFMDDFFARSAKPGSRASVCRVCQYSV